MRNDVILYDVTCVDIVLLTLLASLSHFRTLVQIQNGDDIWPNLRRFINQFIKVGGIETWEELMAGVQHLEKLLFNNNFINPGLVPEPLRKFMIHVKQKS